MKKPASLPPAVETPVPHSLTSMEGVKISNLQINDLQIKRPADQQSKPLIRPHPHRAPLPALHCQTDVNNL